MQGKLKQGSKREANRVTFRSLLVLLPATCLWRSSNLFFVFEFLSPSPSPFPRRPLRPLPQTSADMSAAAQSPLDAAAGSQALTPVLANTELALKRLSRLIAHVALGGHARDLRVRAHVLLDRYVEQQQDPARAAERRLLTEKVALGGVRVRGERRIGKGGEGGGGSKASDSEDWKSRQSAHSIKQVVRHTGAHWDKRQSNA